MNYTRSALFGILAFVLLFSNLQTADSILWDLQISVNLEKYPLSEADIPVVFGTVADHAGKPVPGTEVKIRLGVDSIIRKQDKLIDEMQKYVDNKEDLKNRLSDN